MLRDRIALDVFEEMDDVSGGRQHASAKKKRPYSARFASRSLKSPLALSGPHRRRNKSSLCS